MFPQVVSEEVLVLFQKAVSLRVLWASFVIISGIRSEATVLMHLDLVHALKHEL